MVHQLAYISSTKRPVSDNVLINILEVSRRNNAKDGITGLLIYHDKLFFQLLEGPADRVRECFRRIEDDERHGQTSPVLERDVEARSFPEWEMGLVEPRNLTPEARSAVHGLRFIQTSGTITTEDPAIRSMVRDILREMHRAPSFR